MAVISFRCVISPSQALRFARQHQFVAFKKSSLRFEHRRIRGVESDEAQRRHLPDQGPQIHCPSGGKSVFEPGYDGETAIPRRPSRAAETRARLALEAPPNPRPFTGMVREEAQRSVEVRARENAEE